jgi:hypothetical protein
MRILSFSGVTLGLALGALAGCAGSNPPPEGPTSQTQTTSGKPAADPSYGTGNMNGGWSDPAASGYATHGSGQVGTTPSPTTARSDGGVP